jgi:Clp amino terminal domain, pathogenicity island component
MFERFTERARQVVVFAQDEARTLRHNYIGTEHLLLGLLREDEGLAARVLDSLGITIGEVRAQVARRVGQSAKAPTGRPIHFAQATKDALQLALREALSLGDEEIDAPHILLGLLGDKKGGAARILLDFGADADTIRIEIIGVLAAGGPPVTSGGLFYIPAPSNQLIVACPNCANPLEVLPADTQQPTYHATADRIRTCRGCGKHWHIAYTVSWEEPPAGVTAQ